MDPIVMQCDTFHRKQIRDFVQAVVTGGRPRLEAETAARTLAAILCIYESARRNGFTWRQVRH